MSNPRGSGCQVTGTTGQFGNRVSHSHRRTRRRFEPNLQRKSFWVPSLGRRVTLKLSARGLKVVDARGIDAVVAEMAARGQKF